MEVDYDEEGLTLLSQTFNQKLALATDWELDTDRDLDNSTSYGVYYIAFKISYAILAISVESRQRLIKIPASQRLTIPSLDRSLGDGRGEGLVGSCLVY